MQNNTQDNSLHFIKFIEAGIVGVVLTYIVTLSQNAIIDVKIYWLPLIFVWSFILWYPILLVVFWIIETVLSWILWIIKNFVFPRQKRNSQLEAKMAQGTIWLLNWIHDSILSVLFNKYTLTKINKARINFKYAKTNIKLLVVVCILWLVAVTSFYLFKQL